MKHITIKLMIALEKLAALIAFMTCNGRFGVDAWSRCAADQAGTCGMVSRRVEAGAQPAQRVAAGRPRRPRTTRCQPFFPTHRISLSVEVASVCLGPQCRNGEREAHRRIHRLSCLGSFDQVGDVCRRLAGFNVKVHTQHVGGVVGLDKVDERGGPSVAREGARRAAAGVRVWGRVGEGWAASRGVGRTQKLQNDTRDANDTTHVDTMYGIWALASAGMFAFRNVDPAMLAQVSEPHVPTANARVTARNAACGYATLSHVVIGSSVPLNESDATVWMGFLRSVLGPELLGE